MTELCRKINSDTAQNERFDIGQTRRDELSAKHF